LDRKISFEVATVTYLLIATIVFLSKPPVVAADVRLEPSRTTYVLRLDPDLEWRLERAARFTGLTPKGFIEAALQAEISGLEGTMHWPEGQ
jgi:hypothetical protein